MKHYKNTVLAVAVGLGFIGVRQACAWPVADGRGEATTLYFAGSLSDEQAFDKEMRNLLPENSGGAFGIKDQKKRRLTDSGRILYCVEVGDPDLADTLARRTQSNLWEAHVTVNINGSTGPCVL